MDPLTRLLMQGAAGAAGGDVLGVEDVFSTWLYTGNGSTQTITNGIDLDGEGGLVWIKNRSGTTNRLCMIQLAERATDFISNTTSAQVSSGTSHNLMPQDLDLGGDSS
jgi:hypothetical protein